MTSLKDMLGIDKDAARAKVIGILMGVLTRLGVIGLRELGYALNAYLVEKATPDGWTREERGYYLAGRLTEVRKETIGPAWLDRLIDHYVIDWLIEEATPDGIPGPVDPPPPPAPDPYYRVLTHDEFETLKGELDAGDEVFRSHGVAFTPGGPLVYEWYVEKQGVGLMDGPPEGFTLAYTVSA